jgi:hypothetical protein
MARRIGLKFKIAKRAVRISVAGILLALFTHNVTAAQGLPSYRWANISVIRGELHFSGVPSQPVAIKIPPELLPLGGRALVSTQSNFWFIDFYFDQSDEQKIRKYLSSGFLAVNDIGSLPQFSRVEKRESPGGWSSSHFFETATTSVSERWTDESTASLIASASRMNNALSTILSPLSSRKRVISLSILEHYYSKTEAQKKYASAQ